MVNFEALHTKNHKVNRMKHIFLFSLLPLIFCSPVLSQEEIFPTIAVPTRPVRKAPTPAKKETPLPKSGVISSSIDSGAGKRVVEMPWGQKDVTESDAPPVSGSVSRLNPREWIIKVFNNSEKTYSVSLRLTQFNARGGQTRGDSFSYTLRPKQSAERTVPSASGSVDAQLKLENWKSSEG